MKHLDCTIVIERLSMSDGAGFAALVPDLPGCMSDGQTREEAIANVKDAIQAWMDAALAMGRLVPPPSWRLALAR